MDNNESNPGAGGASGVMATCLAAHSPVMPMPGIQMAGAFKSPVIQRLARRLLGERLFGWLWVIVRVRRNYIHCHGRAPALFWPRRYTEKMQWRKLFELDPIFAVLSDKLASRDFVTERLGAGHSAPLLWVGDDPMNIPFETLEAPYVIKSNHGYAQTVLVTDTASHDAAYSCRLAQDWLDHCHGTESQEPGYTHVPRRIMVERMLLGPGGTRLIEHRAFVFSGKVQVILASLVKEGRPCIAGFFTPNWEPLGWKLETPVDPNAVRRPARLADLIAMAERLGAGLSHVRVDFYGSDDEITVGETTLYSWSGVHPFHPDSADFELGKHWRIRWPVLRALWAVAFCRHEIRPAVRSGTRTLAAGVGAGSTEVRRTSRNQRAARPFAG